jgi:hypothetical protein
MGEGGGGLNYWVVPCLIIDQWCSMPGGVDRFGVRGVWCDRMAGKMVEGMGGLIEPEKTMTGQLSVFGRRSSMWIFPLF